MAFVSLPILAGLTSVFAQISAGGIDLAARAAASPRPAECAPGERPASGGGPEIWRRARRPELAPYCAALARGYSTLASDPKASLDAAEKAEAARPRQPATHVLRARALLASGEPIEAWAEFEAAGSAPWLLRAPEALHDRAIAASLTGHMPEAVSAFRALVPRAELSDRPALRERIYVEAALHVMQLGPEALDEAIGYLTEARRAGPSPGFAPIVLGALALALDRQGKTALAAGVAAEAGPVTVLTSLEPAPAGREASRHAPSTGFLPVLPPGEFAAIVAIVAEARASALARDHWQSFLDEAGDGSRWAAHARGKLAARAAPKPRERR